MTQNESFNPDANASAAPDGSGSPEDAIATASAASSFSAASAASAASADGAQAAASSPDADALQAENAGLKDRILRTMAEMENLRRRTEREVADARAYGASNFARDMLALADNLRRGIDSLSPEERAGASPALQTFIQGVELTEADFLSRLIRHGVKKLAPKGEKFDPNKHEALFEAPDESVPTGTVVQVVEEGYTIGDRVLRPAKVGVSRGGPRAA